MGSRIVGKVIAASLAPLLVLMMGAVAPSVSPVCPQAHAATLAKTKVVSKKLPKKGTVKFFKQKTYKMASLDYSLQEYGSLKTYYGDEYFGGVVDGMREGRGTSIWSNGDRYDGMYSQDQMSGEGTYTFSNGFYLTGVFEKNAFIRGDFCFSNKTGKYRVTYDNGTKTKLYVENNVGKYELGIQGGVFASADFELSNGLSYNGPLSSGYVSGLGEMGFPNGDSYVGQFSRGKRSGNGKYTWRNGAAYDGEWSNDAMNGKGTYYYPVGSKGSRLVGTFKNNKPDGECTYYVSATYAYRTKWVDGRCVSIWR